MRSKSRRAEAPLQDQVDCLTKWLRLKGNADFLSASQEIRRLREKERETAERYSEADIAYRKVFGTEGPAKEAAQKIFWELHDAHVQARNSLETKEQDVCRHFGLFMWWDPDDHSITITNAQGVFGPSFPAEVLDPQPGKGMGWTGKVDKDGWLTLKVNLKASLEESEPVVGRLLRLYKHMLDLPKTRNRPDSNAKALEVWVCFDSLRNFEKVAAHLKRPESTVKGQYVRAHELIKRQRPTGAIKQRRAGIVQDPAGEFQAHLGSCSRCPKAKTPDEFCPKWAAFVNQDTKALRERLC